MKTFNFFIALFLLSFSINAHNQVEFQYKQIVAKIDSISSEKGIDKAMVKFHRVTSTGEDTDTKSYALTKKQRFEFDGQFLVIGEGYYNLDKLLFFFVREDHIEFYFQGY